MNTHVCCGCGGLCDSGHPCPMAYNCKCRRESGDSHAALAAEMRQPPGFWHPKAPEWADRVEQLGVAHEQAKVFHGHEYANRVKLEADREAREAEIAKVREDNVRLRGAMLEIAEGIYKWGSIAGSKSLDFMADKLREAARLGGAE